MAILLIVYMTLKVYSIAPAISQTTNYIHQHQFLYDYTDSTIQSLDKIAKGIGAIAPLGSGETYGYQPIDLHIQDYPIMSHAFNC